MEKEMTLSEALQGSPAESFVKMVRLELQDIRNRFFSIGFRLYEAQQFKYYEKLGYETIEALAEEEFGFKRSTTYGLISVFRNFCITDSYGNKIKELAPEYKAYSYSQLLEMQKMERYYMRTIPAQASVRKINEYRSFVNNNPGKQLPYQEWENIAKNNSDSVQKDISKMTEIKEIESKSAPSGVYCVNVETTYRFDVRDGVRFCLRDYYNWKYYGLGELGEKQYLLEFPNGVTLWALEINKYPNKNDLTFIRKTVDYYLEKDEEGPVRLSKRAIELYCMQNYKELLQF